MKINLTTLIEKLEPTTLAEAVRLGKEDWYVLDPVFGTFSARDAKLLAELLRSGWLLSVVHKMLSK